MEYIEVVIGILILLAVILFTALNPPTLAQLTDQDAVELAQKYILTNYPGSTIVSTTITDSNATGQKWKITINYKQETPQGCKLARCYWEGPASQFCRQESNLSLGSC